MFPPFSNTRFKHSSKKKNHTDKTCDQPYKISPFNHNKKHSSKPDRCTALYKNTSRFQSVHCAFRSVLPFGGHLDVR